MGSRWFQFQNLAKLIAGTGSWSAVTLEDVVWEGCWGSESAVMLLAQCSAHQRIDFLKTH